MSALPVILRGKITTKSPKGGDPSQSGVEQCVIQGLLSIEGLEVGGGPMPGGPGDKPPIERPPGQPTFPIWGPPGINFPDKPGYPPVVGGGPIIPPDTQPVPKWEAKVAWTEETGWIVVLVPGEGTNVPTPSKK